MWITWSSSSYSFSYALSWTLGPMTRCDGPTFERRITCKRTFCWAFLKFLAKAISFNHQLVVECSLIRLEKNEFHTKFSAVSVFRTCAQFLSANPMSHQITGEIVLFGREPRISQVRPETFIHENGIFATAWRSPIADPLLIKWTSERADKSRVGRHINSNVANLTLWRLHTKNCYTIKSD